MGVASLGNREKVISRSDGILLRLILSKYKHKDAGCASMNAKDVCKALVVLANRETILGLVKEV